jgi:aspartyl-tRNA(Asn)/glutamyl-tRNA(Gln) amidotransferase subunit A
LEHVDLLLVPTAVFAPPEIGGESIDATEMLANDVMTVPISLAGLPSVSVPAGGDADSPSFYHGLQLVGARHGEAVMLKAASVLDGL